MKRLRVTIEVITPDLPTRAGHTAIDYARTIEFYLRGGIKDGVLSASGHCFEIEKLWLCGMEVNEDH